MPLLILHDASGRIVAVGEGETDRNQSTGVGILPQAGHEVLHVERSPEHAGKSLREFADGFRIDMGSKRLVER
jgi:hypothetical protein